MTQFSKVISMIVFILVTGSAWASGTEVKGVGTYTYPDIIAPPPPPPMQQNAAVPPQAPLPVPPPRTSAEEEKATTSAITMAKKNAWKNYVAKLNKAKQQLMAKYEKDLLSNVDNFITNLVVLDTAKQDNILRVAVRVEFNDVAIDQFVEALSVGNSQNDAKSKGPQFSFLFMAREQASVVKFDTRNTMVQQSESATTTADDGGISQSQKLVSGGSRMQKKDAVTYAVSSSQDLDSAMGEMLTTSHIEYVGYDDIVVNCEGVPVTTFKDQFVHSDELEPQTRKKIIDAVRRCEVPYFAYGTIDTGIAKVDPITGQQQVFVSVRAQLWDVSKKLPTKIGSVGPKQYSGLGPDQDVASKNALIIAAKDLANNLLDQLNAKGIR